MTRIIYAFVALAFLLGSASTVYGGNPDRQGEAGGRQLLMNPWAESAGLHTMNTSMISGVEAMRLNVAGISRIEKTEFNASYGIYLEGTQVGMSSFGFAQRIGENGGFAVTIMALDFGDIPETTFAQPEGTGATFSPAFFNVGLGYSHIFENKVSVGIGFRAVSERISDLSAGTFAIDAGVQYVTGENDNFKFGISLRNVGGRMRFDGEGLAFPATIPLGSGEYALASDRRAAGYELESVLNIGLSYDFLFGSNARLTALGNFASNAFSRDQIGAGLEFGFKDMLFLRGGYKYEIGADLSDPIDAPLYSGPSAGASLEFPFDKEKPNGTRLGIDYGYRLSKIFGGTHNIGVRLSL